MRIPGPPDWLIYFSAVIGLLLLAGNAPHENSPPAPPPPPGEESLPLDPALPFNPVGLVRLTRGAPLRTGTAFSTASPGSWLTASTMVEGCRRTVLSVGQDKAVLADVAAGPQNGLTTLVTRGGSQPLVPRTHMPRLGERAFVPGFPQGRPGEVTVRYQGLMTLPARHRDKAGQMAMVWAEAGRTDDLQGPLTGLAGAPVIGVRGAVMGVILDDAPRRGRLYSTVPEALTKAGLVAEAEGPQAEPVTIENYGRVADGLRRDLRVAKVLCLAS